MNSTTYAQYKRRQYMLLLISMTGGVFSLAYASWNMNTVPDWIWAFLTSLPVSILLCCGLVIAAVFFNWIKFDDGDDIAWGAVNVCIPSAILFLWQSQILPTYVFLGEIIKDQAFFFLGSVAASCVLWITLAILVGYVTGIDQMKSFSVTALFSSILPFLMPLTIYLTTMDQNLGLLILIAFLLQCAVVAIVAGLYVIHMLRIEQRSP